jgi:uncharacterized protein DUF6894
MAPADMKYYFNIDTPTIVSPEPGDVFESDADAIAAAISIVRALSAEMPEEIRGGHHLTVTREDGIELCRVRLGSAQ